MNAPSNIRSMRPVETFDPVAASPWSLDKQIAEARRDMGETRWQELCAEWDAPVPHVRSNGVRQWVGGVR